MKKNIYFKKLLIVLCLVFGSRGLQAQCTITALSSVGANGIVSFTATALPSSGSPVYSWYFPGSTAPTGPSGTGAWNATSTYTANGTYSVLVSLINTAPTCSTSTTILVNVTTATTSPLNCTLNVISTVASSTISCDGSATVTAPSNMCSAISYTWSNGTTGPVAYSLCPGSTYTVIAGSLTGVNCCSLSTGIVNVTPLSPCNLVANFNWTSAVNGVVNFNNTSTGTSGSATYSWNFGDGTSSSSASPVHTYSANGYYTPTLTVNNNTTIACVNSKVASLLVNTYCNLSAGFTSSNVTSNVIQFNNTTSGSFGPVVSSWSFGDGTGSSGNSPIHTYTATGNYTVSLIAMNPSVTACADTTALVVTINTICVANAGFSLSASGTPQVWNAFPLAPANITSAAWYWGDNSSSNTLYTSHTYSAAGNYSICLSVTVNCGASAVSCYSYAINRSSNDQEIITVNVINPAVTTGLQINKDQDLFNYTIFPNPNNGNFNLSLSGLPTGSVKVSIYNLIGELVFSTQSEQTEGSLSKDIQLNGASGVYFIQVNSNNKASTKKVIIAK